MAKYLKDSGIPIDLIRQEFERYCQLCQLSGKAYKKLAGGNDSAAKAFKDSSEGALKIAKYFESLLRKSKPPNKSEMTELEKFRTAGKKIGVTK
jgi:hypothetical protein